MITRVGLVALVLVLGFFLLLSLLERSLLYPARYRPAPARVVMADGDRELAIEHEQGKTYAHFYPGRGVTAESPGPVVVYSHGNGELIEDYAGGFRPYHDMGVSVLLVEYRGCGNSDGKPTKTRIDADHVAFHDLAAALPEIDAARIVYHGRSMGGGILASLAQQRPPAALILESSYSSIKDYAARLLVPGFIVKDNFDVTATLEQYDGPLLICHSERDEVVPHAMSMKNLTARPDATVLSYDLGHNDPMPAEFYEAVEGFFREHGILEP